MRQLVNVTHSPEEMGVDVVGEDGGEGEPADSRAKAEAATDLCLDGDYVAGGDAE